MTDAELINLFHKMRLAQTALPRACEPNESRKLMRESKRLEQLVDKELRERAPELEQLDQFAAEATEAAAEMVRPEQAEKK